jgi:hypothetical protein
MSISENDGREANAVYIKLSTLYFPIAEAAVDTILRLSSPSKNPSALKETLARACAALSMHKLPNVVRISLAAHEVGNKLHVLINKAEYIEHTRADDASIQDELWACKFVREISDKYRLLLQ